MDDFAGKAVEFNGTDNWMNDSSVILTGPWALSVWVKPTHVGSSTRAIIGKRNGDDTGFPSLFITSDDKLGFGLMMAQAGIQIMCQVVIFPATSGVRWLLLMMEPAITKLISMARPLAMAHPSKVLPP